MTATDGTSKPKRRWLQFSMRGFLLLMVAAAMIFGWTRHNVRQQKLAVAELEKAGYRVDYRRRDQGPLTGLEMLRKLLGEDESRNALWVFGGSQVNDAALVHLQRLGEFGGLNLEGSPITDAGLVHLPGLTQLKALGLSGTPITDAGLAQVQGLRQLLALDLRQTQITDAGLVHLQGLIQLQVLYLNETHVTDAGVQKLQRALPNLTITR